MYIRNGIDAVILTLFSAGDLIWVYYLQNICSSRGPLIF